MLPGYLMCQFDVPVKVKTRVNGWFWRSTEDSDKATGDRSFSMHMCDTEP